MKYLTICVEESRQPARQIFDSSRCFSRFISTAKYFLWFVPPKTHLKLTCYETPSCQSADEALQVKKCWWTYISCRPRKNVALFLANTRCRQANHEYSRCSQRHKFGKLFSTFSLVMLTFGLMQGVGQVPLIGYWPSTDKINAQKNTKNFEFIISLNKLRFELQF